MSSSKSTGKPANIQQAKKKLAEKLLRRSLRQGTRLQAMLTPETALALEYLTLIKGKSKVDVLSELVNDAVRNIEIEHVNFIQELEQLRQQVLEQLGN